MPGAVPSLAQRTMPPAPEVKKKSLSPAVWKAKGTALSWCTQGGVSRTR